jgi:hypothetical protein
LTVKGVFWHSARIRINKTGPPITQKQGVYVPISLIIKLSAHCGQKRREKDVYSIYKKEETGSIRRDA